MSDSTMLDSSQAIAIIGMAGRFPGASNLREFWSNLREGVESISMFSDEELLAEGVSRSLLEHPRYVKAGAILDGIDLFDAAFFGINSREAEIMDPQHRLFLESAWEALEDAGCNPDVYDGTIGVFASSLMSTYLMSNLYPQRHLLAEVGHMAIRLANGCDFLPTRVSYKLNLKGPSICVQTACSSSLVACHLACQSLLDFQTDIALVGGVAIGVPQKQGYMYQEGGIFAPDGHCRAFDAHAQGTVFSNGIGVVVLKRLEDALEERDFIYAVIKGSAINNDGALKVGYTAPSMQGQAEVIAMAQAITRVAPETIGYVEAHGTGTAIGDPVEIEALTRVFHVSTRKKGFCAIGSVKTNIGHLDSAAGVAGLIKSALALKHRVLPPSLHFETPNPEIDFDNTPFYVNTKTQEWKAGPTPRRAAVSSFAIGGTNAHLILEEAPARPPTSPSRPWQLLLLSAKTASALDRRTSALCAHLQEQPDQDLADVAYTLQHGRKAFDYRRMVVCQAGADAVGTLQTMDPKRVLSFSQPLAKPSVVFMFPGQGTQYVHMGAELYQTEPTFRKAIDRCAEILKPQLGLDLRNILYPHEHQAEAAAQQLLQTALTQPAVFMVEYALAQMWREWGIQPEALIGHSIGEYVAACLAGVFSLEDALALVATRGRLMQSLPGGGMIAVSLPAAEVEALLDKSLSLAAVNSPLLCVVAGPKPAVDALEARLTANNVSCRPLHTSHAFHSSMMSALVPVFAERVNQVKRRAPEIPFISNVTGTWITPQDAIDPNYWASHLRQTVRFSEGIAQILQGENRLLLEVGPGRTLSTFVQQHGAGASLICSSMRHPRESGSDTQMLLQNLGKLWLSGAEVDWAGFSIHEQRQRVPLPTYAFDRRRYWIEPPDRVRDSDEAAGQEQPDHWDEQALLTTQSGAPQTRPHLRNIYVAPRNQVEQTLVEIWQSLLGAETVGIHDDFFDLGGHSLVAVQAVSRIRDTLQVKLPLQQMFEASTIAELGQSIAAIKWAARDHTAPSEVTEDQREEIEI